MSALGAVKFDRAAWIGIVVVAAGTMLAAWGFGASFPDSSYVPAVIGGFLVGAGCAVLAARLQLSPLLTTLAAIGAFFVFGTAFAMPSEGIAAVIPSARSLAGLAIGSVHAWKDMVTLTTPLEAPYYLAVGPYLATWFVGLLSVSLLLRWAPTRRPQPWRRGVVLAPVLALYGATVLLGTFDPYWPTVRGLALAALTMLWLSLRLPSADTSSPQTRRAILRYRLVGTAAVVLGALAAGGLASAAVAPAEDQRYVLREHVTPPFDPKEFPSPLAGFRKYTKDLTEDEMFTVSGLRQGDVIRIAVMDAYDGKLWSVTNDDGFESASGAFELVGSTLPLPPDAPLAGGDESADTADPDTDAEEPAEPGLPADAAAPQEREVTFTIVEYSDMWIPMLGYPTALDFGGSVERPGSVIYNRYTSTGATLDGLHEGQTYVVRLPALETPSPDALRGARAGVLDQPTVVNVPSIVVSKAEEYSQEANTPYTALSAIETFLVDNAFLSHGTGSDAVPSLAGHGADRLTALFERSVLIGDEEQYASAFALMARELGYPSRVVMGFAPELPEGGGAVTVLGSDVTAWAEVYFEGYGWVPFFPTPEETDVPRDEEPEPRAEAQPHPRQPPREEDLQDEVASPVQIEEPEEEDEEVEEGLPAWLWPLILAILIPVLLYAIPVLVIAALKSARRARRRNSGGQHDRAAAAWDEVVDSYAELGYAIPPRLTRVERALDFEDQFRDEVAARAGELEEIRRRERQKATAKLAELSAKQQASTVKSPMLSVRAATVVRGKHADAWHPGVAGGATAVAELPGLRELAVDADRAVFADAETSAEDVTRLWDEAATATAAARKSVGWLRRELSKFRIRWTGAQRRAAKARPGGAKQGSSAR